MIYLIVLLLLSLMLLLLLLLLLIYYICFEPFMLFLLRICGHKLAYYSPIFDVIL